MGNPDVGPDTRRRRTERTCAYTHVRPVRRPGAM